MCLDDGVYCSKSDKCSFKTCPKHLNGFWGLYVRIKEFNCDEYIDTRTDSIRKEDDTMFH